jgi:hypothetical protein
MPRKRKNTRSTPHECALVQGSPMITRDNTGNCSAESGGARDISRRAPGGGFARADLYFFFQICGSNRKTGRRSFPRGPEESWGARISPPTCSPNDTKS